MKRNKRIIVYIDKNDAINVKAYDSDKIIFEHYFADLKFEIMNVTFDLFLKSGRGLKIDGKIVEEFI